VFITNVVGQFQLVERDDFLHPLLARRRRVGVDVHALGHLRIGFARHHPSTANQKQLSAFLLAFQVAGNSPVVEFVPVIVGRDDVEQQNVLGLIV
jgi:hypothetical protein